MTAPKALRRPRRNSGRAPGGSAGGTLIGIFIGVVVGLGLAAGVAYWLMRNNPALPMPTLSGEKDASSAESAVASPSTPGKPRFDFYKILPGVEDAKPRPDASRAAAGAPATPVTPGAARATAPAPAASPGTAPAPGTPPAPGTAPAANSAREVARAAASAIAPATATGNGIAQKPGARSWLQAGSFTTDADAENLKARLALAGLEATVQAGALSDGSLRYRVRLGPYDNADELGRMKSELARRGFDVAVVR